MRKFLSLVAVGIAVSAGAAIAADQPKGTPDQLKLAAGPEWAMNATIIEACSCPMFCQCYFNTKPAPPGGHAGHEHPGEHPKAQAGEAAMAKHYCKFNNAFRVNKGNYGGVKLDGIKFWIAGDLGDEFSDGEMEWAVATFEPGASKEQREAVSTILGSVYPVKWKSFTVGTDAPIEWTATKARAVAKLNGGKGGEVVLNSVAGMTSEPVVIKILKYWGVPRNDGFVLMTNEVEAYRVGEQAFEFKGTNGFMITFDITSKDAAPKKM